MKSPHRKTTWTPERDEIVRTEWTAGKTASQIARKISVSPSAVIARARRLGVDGRPSPIKRVAALPVQQLIPGRTLASALPPGSPETWGAISKLPWPGDQHA